MPRRFALTPIYLVNFWLDVHSALEEGGLKVINIETLPGRLGAEPKRVVLIIHDPVRTRESRHDHSHEPDIRL